MNKEKNRPSKLEELLKPIAGENRVYLEKLEICGTDKFVSKPLSDLTEDDQISIVSDAMLKTMLGSEKFKKYICKLLSDLLNCDMDYLMENTQYYKNEHDKTSVEDKGRRGDLVLKLGDDYIIVEMNVRDEHQRTVEYADKIYASSIRIGSQNVYPIVLAIDLNNYYYKEIEEPMIAFWLQSDKQLSYMKKVHLQIYLPKYHQKWYNEGDRSNFTKTLLTMCETTKSKAESIAKGDDILEQYVVDAEYSKYYDNELREAYDHEQSAALAAREDALVEGREEGIKLGKEEGIQVGITKGRSEERTDIIQNMFADGVSLETIAKYTNSTVEEIKSLRETLKQSKIDNDE